MRHPKSSAATKTVIASEEELRSRLETARLDLRALYRSLDQLHLLQRLPPELRVVQELDADFAEALWVLDQPKEAFDRRAMTKDTVAALARLPEARKRLLSLFDDPTRALVEERSQVIRGRLSPNEAYLEVPGRDPLVR